MEIKINFVNWYLQSTKIIIHVGTQVIYNFFLKHDNLNKLYGADILIAKQIVQRLLNYEKNQSGLNLTHGQDKDNMQVGKWFFVLFLFYFFCILWWKLFKNDFWFLFQNLVLGISWIIHIKEKPHWDGIKHLINENYKFKKF